MIIDFGEEKRLRRHVAFLQELFTEAQASLRHSKLNAEGVFIVLKVATYEGPPTLQYIQEGVTKEDLERVITEAFTKKQ